MFQLMMGSQEMNLNKIKMREAVRAVIFQKNLILLVQSNRGDFKFPGGGVEKGEGLEEALIREIAEETAYINSVVKEKIGLVVEQRADEFESDTIFQMNSHYFICELLDEEMAGQKLDDYEAEQEFTPKWVSLDEAIEQNQLILTHVEHNAWIQRENFVLNELKKMREEREIPR